VNHVLAVGENIAMSTSAPPSVKPMSLTKEGDDRLVIVWSDGHRAEYHWRHLRDQCPCAGCREERLKPPDPLRVLKASELVPLKPVAFTPVGYYAYKITWSDGHDSGLFTLENLRSLCECPACQRERQAP
jgi:DUF971 family protein